jgi:hypothetical protein
MKRKGVRLILYRYGGKFLFFRSRQRCEECDISYVILQRLIAEQLQMQARNCSIPFAPTASA